MRRKMSAEEFLKNGPHAHLAKKINKMPELSRDIMEVLADAVVQRAKENIVEARDMDPLWEEAQELYKWTPEFNNESRISNRNDADPLVDTGELHDAIEVLEIKTTKTRGASATIGVEGDAAGKAWKHEMGGDNPLGLSEIPARPFLGPAIEHVMESGEYDDIIEELINEHYEGR